MPSLIEWVAQRSEGGHVLLRYAAGKGRGRPKKWRVSVRVDGKDRVSTGQTIDAALRNAFGRVMDRRSDTYDRAPPG